jgi:hypothetical protein
MCGPIVRKVQLLRGGLSDLPILRVRARSCGANPGGLCTPPTAVRWDPKRLQMVGDKKGMYHWPFALWLGPRLYQQNFACVFRVPIGVVFACAAVRCMTLAATPFACCALFCSWRCIGSVVVVAARRLL